jgi:hypothetical protein
MQAAICQETHGSCRKLIRGIDLQQNSVQPCTSLFGSRQIINAIMPG